MLLSFTSNTWNECEARSRPAVLFADYLATKRRAKLSEKHLADIKQRPGRFVADFSDRAIKTLTVREIEDWLHGSISPLKRSITFARLSEHSSNTQSDES
jgi:hypothetical protein